MLENQKRVVETDFETFTSLTFIDDDDDAAAHWESESDDDEDTPKASTSYQPSPQKAKYPDIDMERMKEIVAWRTSQKTGQLKKVSTVVNQFRLRDDNHYYYIERIVKKSGTRQRHLREIEEHVLGKFTIAVANRCHIHDTDVKRWALQKKRELQYDAFKASDSWLLRFKQRNRIAIRAITHIVSKKAAENSELIKATGISFVESMKPLFPPNNLHMIFNTDQSGFKKELHTGATLSFIGVKRVEASVQSVNATTHSYTIMPLISADGILHSPMFLVHQESGDEFGPRVTTTMTRPANLYVRCSKSGLMKKSLMDEWFLHIFLQGEPTTKHLLCDSLSTYKNTSNIDALKPVDQNYELHSIPAGTTGFVQPLDVMFFRQWKSFAKKISDHVLMEDYDTQLFQRDNITTLQSLIHNQFSAPRFQPFVRQAWVKAGYYKLVEVVENPIDICFKGLICCSLMDCEATPVVRCAYCEQQLCFRHFFNDFHHHNF